MPEIITLGEILVEIMREKVDVPLCERGEFLGPFPSGAPAIFIDTTARLGKSSGIIGAVGRDDFGDLVWSRLNEDGVDVSEVKRMEDEFTGTAFVTYFSDGSRKFLFHVGESSSGTLSPEDVSEEYIRSSSALHISGASLTMCKEMREACYKAVEIASDSDTLISFDPNMREESISGIDIRKIVEPVLRESDLLTPGLDELTVITGCEDEEKAIKKVLEKGIEIVGVKIGEKGCRVYTEDERLELPSFSVEEVDPTGAGDAFSGAFLVGWMEGMKTEKIGLFANAVGARAVSAKGPMDGVPRREEVEEMLADKSFS